MKVFPSKSITLCFLLCLSVCSNFHFRPSKVPHSAVWVDGTFIDASLVRRLTDVLSARTIPARFWLMVYSFSTPRVRRLTNQNCIMRLLEMVSFIYRTQGNWCHGCHRSVTQRAASSDDRLRGIAVKTGKEATECQGSDSRPDDVYDCALRAMANRQPFYAKYYRQGVDSFTFIGFAGDADGNVYEVDYDSLGWSGRDLPGDAQLLDGNHTFVMPCPKPVSLRKTLDGMLECARPISSRIDARFGTTVGSNTPS